MLVSNSNIYTLSFSIGELLALPVTQETVKEVKAARARLNNDFKELEQARISVKKTILAPYDHFESMYKESTGITLASTSGFIKGLGWSAECAFAFLPTETGGSTTAYIPDNTDSNPGWRVLIVSGGNSGISEGRYIGLFNFSTYNVSSYSKGEVGTRLIFLP